MQRFSSLDHIFQIDPLMIDLLTFALDMLFNSLQLNLQASPRTMTIRTCYLAFTLENGEVYKLASHVQCRPEHSFSAIIAVTNYLLKYLPEIEPPYPSTEREEIKEQIAKGYNPLEEYWNDYLMECATKQMAMRHNSAFYIFIPMEHLEDATTIIKKSHLLALASIQDLNSLSNRGKVSKIFDIPLVESKKKIGICQPRPDRKVKLKIPRITMAALFLGILFNNQKWQVFDIPKASVPQVEELLTFDSIIITGSSFSAIDQTKQISLSLHRLFEAYEKSDRLKMIGVCYGHQVIAGHFGAQVVGKQRTGGVQSIFINQEAVKKYQFLQAIREIDTLLLSEHHKDYVQTVPDKFQLIATSNSCKVEALVSQDKRIFTTQFHSEILYPYAKSVAASIKNCTNEDLGYNLEQPIQVVEKNINHSLLLFENFRAFLDS